MELQFKETRELDVQQELALFQSPLLYCMIRLNSVHKCLMEVRFFVVNRLAPFPIKHWVFICIFQDWSVRMRAMRYLMSKSHILIQVISKRFFFSQYAVPIDSVAFCNVSGVSNFNPHVAKMDIDQSFVVSCAIIEIIGTLFHLYDH